MINVQTCLLLIVSALILFDAYITYATYKQTEKDYGNLKYDVEAMRMALNMVKQDVDHHKDHINALKENITTLHETLEPARKPGRPKKELEGS